MPPFVVAHAVVHHLRMQFQQIKIQIRFVGTAAADLRFRPVACARPMDMAAAFSEQRTAMSLTHIIKQLFILQYLKTRVRRHRLRRVMVQLMRRRNACMDVQIRGRRLVATVDFRSVHLRVFQRMVAFQAIALHFRATVVPRLAPFAVVRDDDGFFVERRRVRIQIDVVFMERPRVAAVVGGLSEFDHGGIAAQIRIRGNMVRKLHVIAETLPAVVDDGGMVDAHVLQQTQVVAIGGETSLRASPEVQHDFRAKQFAVFRRLPRDVRQDFRRIGRIRDVREIMQRIAFAVVLRVIGRTSESPRRI